MKKIIKISALAIILLGFAQPVIAQQPNPAPDLFINFQSNDFRFVLSAIVQSGLALLGIVSVFYLIWGGYQFMLSGMNSEMAERGKKTLRYAITGLIIAILSYIIVTVVVNSLFKLQA